MVAQTEFNLQLKVRDFPPLPDEEGVALGGDLCGRFPDNGAVLDPPESRITIPSGQCFPVKQRDKLSTVQ